MSIEDDIAAKKARLDALRPLTGASLAAIEAWYDVELTFTSNAIEGNTLTRSETAIVLEKGITIGGKPIKDHLEAIDHRDALGFARWLATGSQPITEADICRIHALVVAKTLPDQAGVYSQFQRRIAGSTVVFPAPAKLRTLMQQLADWVGQAPAIPATAFESHYRVVGVHPFSDGNGRTARLLMNLFLFRSGYPPVVIGPVQRTAYLDVLEQAQLGGSKQPYESFMLTRLDASLTDYLAHCEKEVEGGTT